MKLVRARLRNFRLFQDTGEVPLEQITALLAQNENGKTAFLQGLAWFSVEGVRELDEEDVWQGLDSPVPSQASVVVTFTRESGDLERLKEQDIRLPKTLRATRFGGNARYRFEDAESGQAVGTSAERDAIKAFAQHIADLREAIAGLPTRTPQRTRALASLDEFDLFYPRFRANLLGTSVREKMLPGLPDEEQTMLVPIVAAFESSAEELEEAAADSAARVLTALPNLIYFDSEVDMLPDRAAYSDIDSDPEGNRTILNLGRLADVNFAFIPTDPHHRLQRGRRFQETISKQTSRFWRGHPVTFELSLDADAVTVSVVSQGRFQKPSRRSRGIRWYHGFHINFMAETKGELRDTVLLLDEPGLFLHPSAQEGLLELFEAIAVDNQIIYSTHLPFMIPRDRPERIRLLVEQDDGTVVVESKPHRGSDADVMKPLRAAIGMGIGDTISLGKRTLVCEGIADLYILRAASAFNERESRASLPKTTTVLPAGGTDKILTLASFLVGEIIDGVVLVDDDTAGRRLETQIGKRFADLVPVVRTHDTPRSETASGLEIEDLFGAEYYCDLVNESLTHLQDYQPLSPADLDGAGPIVDRVKVAFEARGLGTFQKLLPAIAFAGRVNAGRAPDDETADRFAELFERMRSARR